MIFSRILVPLDGSERAERVLSQAARLLRREESELILARAVFTPPSLARIDTATLDVEHQREAHDYLRKVVDRLAALGLRSRAEVLQGPADAAILDAVHREKISLVAMSTHGRGGLSRWIMGSVAERVIRESEVPTFLLRSFRPDARGLPVPVGDGQVPIRRILVPLDGSDLGRAALPAAHGFAKLFDAEILLLHVGSSGETPDVESLAGDLRLTGVRAAVRRVEGDPAGRILDEAEAENVDLIAMATHGRSGFARWRIGRVVERVLRSATMPLLVVRPTSAGS
jgi:nucleotide-binding universal stress UspA family protein